MTQKDDGTNLDERLGPIDFSTFIISLASSVSIHLTPDHEAHDPSMARQTIDILAILQEKTAGNLSADEEKLLSGLLYQTRLAYCDSVKG